MWIARSPLEWAITPAHHQDIGGEPGMPTIAIAKGVDLNQAMMESSRLLHRCV